MEPVGQWPGAVGRGSGPGVGGGRRVDVGQHEGGVSDWARFERWVVDAGYGCLPASDMVVAAYLSDPAAGLRLDGRAQFSPTTLLRWVSSINQIHTAAGLPAPGRSEVVRRALSGSAGCAGPHRNAAAHFS